MPLLTELGNLILFWCYKDTAPTALNMTAWVTNGLEKRRPAVKSPTVVFILVHTIPGRGLGVGHRFLAGGHHPLEADFIQPGDAFRSQHPLFPKLPLDRNPMAEGHV